VTKVPTSSDQIQHLQQIIDDADSAMSTTARLHEYVAQATQQALQESETIEESWHNRWYGLAIIAVVGIASVYWLVHHCGTSDLDSVSALTTALTITCGSMTTIALVSGDPFHEHVRLTCPWHRLKWQGKFICRMQDSNDSWPHWSRRPRTR
jgi:Fe2+ transport system protein B